jgi:arginyl-tRNA synthetase
LDALSIDYRIDILLEEPPKPEYGDLSTPIALRLAKVMGRKPIAIANEIMENISRERYISDVQVAPPGYINFFADKKLLYTTTLDGLVNKLDRFLDINVGGGAKIRIEHTSVNPNKAIHIGHARNMVLGDSLAKIMDFLGYEVEVLNYIDDTGVQMADLIIGFKYLGFSLDSGDIPFDQYCGDIVYVTANEKIESSGELQDIRRRVLREIEGGESNISIFARELADKVLRHQLNTAKRLGVTYDYLIWESDIVGSDMHRKGFELVKGSPLIDNPDKGRYKDCWVVRVERIPEFRGESDEVLVRSDGTMTYLGKDIIFAMWKLGLFKYPLVIKKYIDNDGKVIWSSSPTGDKRLIFDECLLSINVIGVEQRRPQEILRRVLASIYGDEILNRYIHYAYESVVLSKNTAEKYLGLEVPRRIQRMSGRRGIYINTDPFLDMLSREAYKIAKNNNPDLDEDTLRNISESLAITALRYNLLNSDRDKLVVFDVDKMLDVKGESGTYIMYSYARASGVMRKIDKYSVRELYLDGMDPVEDRFLMELSRFRLRLVDVARDLEVKRLTRYIYNLSLIFNEFYEKCPIIKADSSEVRNRRILLTKAYMSVMEVLSGLLGFKLVGRM